MFFSLLVMFCVIEICLTVLKVDGSDILSAYFTGNTVVSHRLSSVISHPVFVAVTIKFSRVYLE